MLPGRLLEAAGDRRPRGMIAARLFGNRIRLTATPDAQKGAHMPEIPADEEQTKKQGQASTPSAVSAGRKLFRLRLVVPVLVVAVVLCVMYGREHLSSTLGSARRAVSDRNVGPLFSRVPADQLLSSDKILRAVGRSPVDPGRVLSPGLEKVQDTEAEKTPAARPSDAEDAIEPEGQTKTAPVTEEGKVPSDTGAPEMPPRPGTPPSVEMRGPGATGTGGGESQAEDLAAPKKREAQSQEASVDSRGPTPTVGRFEDREKARRGDAKHSGKRSSEDSSPAGAPVAAVEPGRTDQFQLPGSLTVKIHQYSGTVPKWGLMVILDDSASMSRKLKSWSPNRLNSAVNIVEKLPDALERGSRIGIRDFMCNKRNEKPSASDEGCLSHTLYEWASAPFQGMKEKLAQNDSGGKTNPCAAAVYSLKRDFASLGGLAPRLLLVTDGAKRCAFKEVLGAIEKQVGRDKVSVDVLGLGMHRKRQTGYSKLAERTNGMFFRIDSPSDVQGAMAKYAKLLKTPVKERLEVRGGKTVLTASPDEEITLVPGAYTIVLPAVAGIGPSKRTLEAVQIRSGESTVVQIKVKKGRPVAKIEKK
jgi:hypothetical protein